MNVLIIVPPYPNRVKEYLILPSLEVCVCSQILKDNGHEVEMIDMKIENISIHELYTLLPNYSPNIVLIDDDSRTHCNTKKILSIIHDIFKKKVEIVLRGEIATFVPESVMERNKQIDYVIRYDDDYALLNIINAEKDKEKLSEIKNIGYRLENGYKVTERECRKYSLDSLPMPDRRIYNISKYLYRDSETIVRSSRGCPSNCLFCTKSKFANFGTFSMSRFCDEIEELQKYRFKSFFFSDDTFAFSDNRLEEFANEIRKRNLRIKWTSNIRIKDINEYKIKLMKELGAYRVFVGIETANSKTSKLIGKNLQYNEILEKIEILHKYNMEFHASFILGNPGDTVDDIEETIKLVRRIKPTLVTFNLIKIYPGIDLYTDPEKYGIVLKDKYWYEKDAWSKEVVAATKDMSMEELEMMSKKCLFEFISA